MTYEAEKVSDSQIELELIVQDDLGSEEIMLTLSLDPTKYDTNSTSIDGRPIEIELQTNPKIDQDKVQNYANIGESLGKVEKTISPVIESVTVLSSLLQLDVSK